MNKQLKVELEERNKQLKVKLEAKSYERDSTSDSDSEYNGPTRVPLNLHASHGDMKPVMTSESWHRVRELYLVPG